MRERLLRWREILFIEITSSSNLDKDIKEIKLDKRFRDLLSLIKNLEDCLNY